MNAFEIRVYNLLNINPYSIFIIYDKKKNLLGVYNMYDLEYENIPYIDCIVDEFRVNNKRLEIYLDIVSKR
jgi:hypothetical protein